MHAILLYEAVKYNRFRLSTYTLHNNAYFCSRIDLQMEFNIAHKDTSSNARAGLIKTDHGEIQTPIFMPVGTAGSVKAVHQRELKEDIEAQIILGNTYHLFLRPGLDTIEGAGGLHKFNGWDGPILTDSGGYQVYSLADKRKIKESGVVFQSHVDGTRYEFTPEYVMDIQRVIGADIMMAFDECTPYPCDYDYAKKSMEMTHRWLGRCIDRFDSTEPKYGYNQNIPKADRVQYGDRAYRRFSLKQVELISKIKDLLDEGYTLGRERNNLEFFCKLVRVKCIIP